MNSVRFIGAGAFVPRRVVSNERIAKAIPGWSAEKIAEKTGIVERRFLWDFDEKTGRALVPPEDSTLYPRCNTDMCEVALKNALQMAGVPATELDALFVVTCSPDELNFSHDAMLVHGRLGCRTDCYAMVFDSGCGGTLYTLDMARKMILGGAFKTIAVVASNFTSAYLDRDVFTSPLAVPEGQKPLNAYLSMYLFGDGAGAVILRGDWRSNTGIVASTAGTAYSDLVVRKGGGALRPPHAGRATPADHAYIVDGPLVATSFPAFMKRSIEEVTAQRPDIAAEVKRYYLHQPNKRIRDAFAKEMGLPLDRVASHADRYGNTSAAGLLILLAEDLAEKKIELGSGDPVLLAAVGAGVHYGAQLVRL